MSILLNFTNFGITIENQKFITPFIDKIVVKPHLYLKYIYVFIFKNIKKTIR